MKRLPHGLAICFALALCATVSAQDFRPATNQQVSKIEYFLEDGFTLRNAYSARPEGQPAGSSGHFVAAEIVGSGGYVGVWWHGGTQESPSIVLAVDHIADEACICQWARNTRSNVSINDDPARELKQFVEGL